MGMALASKQQQQVVRSNPSSFSCLLLDTGESFPHHKEKIKRKGGKKKKENRYIQTYGYENHCLVGITNCTLPYQVLRLFLSSWCPWFPNINRTRLDDGYQCLPNNQKSWFSHVTMVLAYNHGSSKIHRTSSNM